MTHASGDLVGERYRLGKQIGQGGSAIVWEAFDTTLRRRVAAKFLIAKNRNRETVERRFLREARIAAAVRHPNVVEVFDFGVSDDLPYMIMELLEGASLANRTREPPLLGVGGLLDIVDGVLSGLSAVHEAGIVHRDVKPENIFLASGENGAMTPKLFDFGVSRIRTGEGSISAATTVEGYLVGTPHYMSSEQARGEKNLDARTDVYSAGVVLYEYLTGRLPFHAELMGDLVIKIATETEPTVRSLRGEVGEPLSDLVQQAMAKSPHDRFESAGAMRDALREAREATPELEDLATRIFDRAVHEQPETLDPPAIPMPWDNEPDVDLPAVDAEPAPIAMDVDFDLPPAAASSTPRRSWRTPAIAAAAAIGVAALVGLYVASSGDETNAPSTSAPPPQTQVLPTTVTIDLRGVPEGADVLLDGREVEGTQLELARDEEDHSVEVRAEGMEPFTLVHLARADATYDVVLSPVPEPEVAPVEEPDPEPVRTGRRRRPREPSAEAESGNDIFRRLDF